MTDDISKYTFDFTKEAGDLIRDMGSKGKNILFVETDVTQPGGDNAPPQVTPRRIIGDEELKRENGAGAAAYVTAYYNENPKRSSRVFTLRENGDGNIMGHIIALRKNEGSVRIFGTENESLMHLWILYHETGHALLPEGPNVDKDHPFKEYTADAYAALRFFQRFGREAADLLSMISWNRAYDAVTAGNTDNLTTPVLDKIIADSEHRDFSQMSPAETIELADRYAKEWTPEVPVLTSLRSVFAQGMKISFSPLAETCLAAPDIFSFYVGAKFFQPFLHPDGIVYDGQTIQMPDEDRQHYAAAFNARASGTGLREIFGPAALKSKMELPLVAAVKVSRPKGQKPFTLNS